MTLEELRIRLLAYGFTADPIDDDQYVIRSFNYDNFSISELNRLQTVLDELDPSADWDIEVDMHRNVLHRHCFVYATRTTR